MSWEILNVSGTVSGSWEVLRVSGNVTSAVGAWQILGISGTVTTSAGGSWEILGFSGATVQALPAGAHWRWDETLTLRQLAAFRWNGTTCDPLDSIEPDLGDNDDYHPPPLPAITGWGSSSMEGVNSNGRNLLWWLEDDFRVTSTNGGSRGEFSGHAAARSNGVKVGVTLTGNQIPAAATPVVVTAHTFGTNLANVLSVLTGTLAGVPGRLTWAANVWSFTRTTAGTAVATDPLEPFTSTIGVQHRYDTQLIWTGKNDAKLGGTAAYVTAALSNIAEMWQHMTAIPRHTLVLGSWLDQNQAAGANNAQLVLNLNAGLSAAYGQFYVDVQTYLMSPQVWSDAGITPTATDLSQQAQKVLPDSLTSDSITSGGVGQHLNELGYSLVAHLVATKMVALGWYTLTPLPKIWDGNPATLTISDGQPVPTWPPASGSLETMPAIAIGQPAFRANAVNGMPALEFDSTLSQRYDTGAFSVTYDTPITLAAMFKRDSAVVAMNVATGRGTVYCYIGCLADGRIAMGAGGTIQIAKAPIAEGWFIVVAVFNGDESHMYLNSMVPVASGTTGTDDLTAGLPGLRIASNAAGSANYFDGKIARVIPYDGAMPQVQVAELVELWDADTPAGLGFGKAPFGTSPFGG